MYWKYGVSIKYPTNYFCQALIDGFQNNGSSWFYLVHCLWLVSLTDSNKKTISSIACRKRVLLLISVCYKIKIHLCSHNCSFEELCFSIQVFETCELFAWAYWVETHDSMRFDGVFFYGFRRLIHGHLRVFNYYFHNLTF